MEKKYIYKSQDITVDILFKEEQVVSIISEKSKKSFDEVYGEFLLSNTYEGLQNTATLLWAESAEFIVDEFYREKAGVQ